MPKKSPAEARESPTLDFLPQSDKLHVREGKMRRGQDMRLCGAMRKGGLEEMSPAASPPLKMKPRKAAEPVMLALHYSTLERRVKALKIPFYRQSE